MPYDTRAAPSRRSGPLRRLLVLLFVALSGTLASAIAIVPAAGAADASASARHTSDGSEPSMLRRDHGRVHRVGGRVRSAWPSSGTAPRTRRARWLAREVGAVTPRPCATRWREARRRCHLRPRLAHAAAATAPLQLVRSFAIPPDDPSYNALTNWSWTYDSAVSAAAFAASGDQANSAQLLDQLSALQHTDGSIEIAFNTATGDSAPVFRSGTAAWVGLAAATYDRAFGTSRYVSAEQRVADWLLALRTESGLIKGGPAVGWVSTEHNLIAHVFLSRLASELRSTGDATDAARYQAAATTIATAIGTNLLVVDAAGARFRQGLGDDTQALDVQALGAMFLQGTGQPALAASVLAYAQSTFAVDGRSLERSSDPATYNLTYAAAGPFSGYAPYAGSGAPRVLWAEASGQMRLAAAALGQDTGALDASIAAWAAISAGQGPLQADRTVASDALGVQYHVWPASNAAAWTMLSRSAPAFFAAPLPPATTLVGNWTRVRGGNLVTTYPDGRVDMTTPLGGGERRVLASNASPTASDYTITSNATLLSGAGYGVYVRTVADAATKLTGYCAQLDRVYAGGQLVVRGLQSDVELGVPIAHVAVPAGFAWYGTPHTLAVTVSGNTMTVVLDGTPLLAVPDLAAASAFAVKYAFGPTSTLAAPAAGGYGLRSWGDGRVSLQQMTVGPAS